MLLQSLLSLFFLSVTLLSSLSFFKVMFSTLFFDLLYSPVFLSLLPLASLHPPPFLSVLHACFFFILLPPLSPSHVAPCVCSWRPPHKNSSPLVLWCLWFFRSLAAFICHHHPIVCSSVCVFAFVQIPDIYLLKNPCWYAALGINNLCSSAQTSHIQS